jgi:uncharacterized membrane protein
MNRQEYLNRLKGFLNRLPESEREEILRDQEELIRDALASGRQEEEFIASLGDPRALASALIAEARIQKLEEGGAGGALRHTLPALLAVLTLAPFNFIFLLGPYLAMVGVLIAGWAVVAGGVAVGAVLLGVFFSKALEISVGWPIHASSFLTLLGVTGLFIFFGTCMAFITKFFFLGSVRYLRWNLNLVRRL